MGTRRRLQKRGGAPGAAHRNAGPRNPGGRVPEGLHPGSDTHRRAGPPPRPPSPSALSAGLQLPACTAAAAPLRQPAIPFRSRLPGARLQLPACTAVASPGAITSALGSAAPPGLQRPACTAATGLEEAQRGAPDAAPKLQLPACPGGGAAALGGGGRTTILSVPPGPPKWRRKRRGRTKADGGERTPDRRCTVPLWAPGTCTSPSRRPSPAAGTAAARPTW